jgi:hypothetical protein
MLSNLYFKLEYDYLIPDLNEETPIRRKTMDFKYYNGFREHVRGSEFTPGPMEKPALVDNPMIGQSIPVVEAQEIHEDPAGKEKEEQLELWMKEIKAFIRSIDVSTL